VTAWVTNAKLAEPLLIGSEINIHVHHMQAKPRTPVSQNFVISSVGNEDQNQMLANLKIFQHMVPPNFILFANFLGEGKPRSLIETL
jgi:hypothetical protein